ncbi:unnamed protein product [Closterium sp. Naga37s-1]|nr:unnamed protein product [Closterium sp. Naga37s-1]
MARSTLKREEGEDKAFTHVACGSSTSMAFTHVACGSSTSMVRVSSVFPITSATRASFSIGPHSRGMGVQHQHGAGLLRLPHHVSHSSLFQPLQLPNPANPSPFLAHSSSVAPSSTSLFGFSPFTPSSPLTPFSPFTRSFPFSRSFPLTLSFPFRFFPALLFLNRLEGNTPTTTGAGSGGGAGRGGITAGAAAASGDEDGDVND